MGHKSEVATLENQNKILEQELNAKIAEMEKLNSQYLIDAGQFQAQIKEREEQLLTVDTDSKNQISDLNNKFEKLLITKETEFNSKIAELNKQLEGKLSEIADSSATYKDLMGSNEKLRQNIEIRNAQLAELNQKLKALTEVNGKKDNLVSDLKSQVSSISTKLKDDSS